MNKMRLLLGSVLMILVISGCGGSPVRQNMAYSADSETDAVLPATKPNTASVDDAQVSSLPGTSYGYVEGIGIVDVSRPFHVLSEPVAQSLEGVIVTVEKGVLASDKTVLWVVIDGGKLCEHDENVAVKLPDGTSSQLIQASGVDDWTTGYETLFSFDTLPANTYEADLFLPCIRSWSSGAVDQSLVVPVRFNPTASELTVYPVVMGETVQDSPSQNPMNLEYVLETDSGYIVVGEFNPTDLPPDLKAVDFAGEPKITDAKGQEIPFKSAKRELDISLEPTMTGIIPWAYAITGRPLNWPLTITVDALMVEDQDEVVSFEFVTEPNPQKEQEWDLNIELGEIAGHPVKVIKAIGRIDGYEFYFSSPFMVGVEIDGVTEHSAGMDAPGAYSAYIKFPGEIPTGDITVHVTRPIIQISGLWQVQWRPTDPSFTIPMPTETSEEGSDIPCLSKESWQAALANPVPVPGGLSGKFFLFDLSDDTGEYQINTVEIGGTDIREITKGSSWLSSSPDGTQVVYGQSDGIYIENLTTGNMHQIPNTLSGDAAPFWSPEGTQIAFSHFELADPQGENPDLVGLMEPDLYVINLDGSGRQQVSHDIKQEHLLGWSTDGLSIFYGVDTRNGYSLRKMNLVSGESSDVLVDAVVREFPISPDGKKIVFEVSMDSENPSYGLYTSNLDGSNRKLIGMAYINDNFEIFQPVWSPDGKWLAVSIKIKTTTWETNSALVNVEACQIIPLPFQQQEVISWIP